MSMIKKAFSTWGHLKKTSTINVAYVNVQENFYIFYKGVN